MFLLNCQLFFFLIFTHLYLPRASPVSVAPVAAPEGFVGGGAAGPGGNVGINANAVGSGDRKSKELEYIVNANNTIH